ncbi:hypothetical protein [Streptococcus uberis]|uniref:hypothetical protein n=1 Tax=Streptococcus uberis TaxID=1349 RepID=UPI001FF4C789|nr:hypothetical protein [Streptococcus uberis]MCK1226017.1 hypothetical protein [Streptococcus uberis]
MKQENKQEIKHTPAHSKVFIGKDRIKINGQEIFGVTAINIKQKDHKQQKSVVTISFNSKDVLIEENAKVGIYWVAPEIDD